MQFSEKGIARAGAQDTNRTTVTARRPQFSTPRSPLPAPLEVIILAGGLSSRMGRDKARLRWRGRTLFAWVRVAARATGWPVRVIRHDLVPRCGPLGGVWTAFQRGRARRLVFLSCDMPFVTPELIRAVAERKGRGVFTVTADGAGFPFALDRDAFPNIEQALAEKRLSLQSLATRLRARRLRLPAARRAELRNLNTPEDLADAISCGKALARPGDGQ